MQVEENKIEALEKLPEEKKAITNEERVIALAALCQQDVDGLRKIAIALRGPQTHRLSRLLLEMSNGTERVLKLVMEKFTVEEPKV